MPSFKKDYGKVCRLQDKFLNWWTSLNLPFYLTGGTALGRYYLGHRYSEDLDFFVNADPNYTAYVVQYDQGVNGYPIFPGLPDDPDKSGTGILNPVGQVMRIITCIFSGG
jgi:hypothetical protein